MAAEVCSRLLDFNARQLVHKAFFRSLVTAMLNQIDSTDERTSS